MDKPSAPNGATRDDIQHLDLSVQGYLGIPLYVTLNIYLTFMAITGITGNTFILIASSRYRVIDIDKCSLICIKHLAVADVIYSIVVTGIMAINSWCGTWCLGDTVCEISSMIKWIPQIAETFFIFLLTAYRVFTIKLALRVQIIKTKHIHIVSVIIWIISTIPIIFRLSIGVGAIPDGISSVCVEDYFCVKAAVVALPIMSVCLFLVPLFGCIFSNGILLYYSVSMMRLERKPSYFTPLVTVSVLSLVFLVSVLPYNIYLVLRTFHLFLDMSDLRSNNPIQLGQACMYIINSSVNPLLYTFTNRRFRLFVMKMLKITPSVNQTNEVEMNTFKANTSPVNNSRN